MPRLEFRRHAVRLYRPQKMRAALDKSGRFTAFKTMLKNAIALFKARRDPELAKRLAGEMIVEGAIDRASWPIIIAKLWMGVALTILLLVISLLLWAAIALHGSFAIPALLLGGLSYAIIKVWMGLNNGTEKVTRFANEMMAQQTRRIGQKRIPNTEK